MDDGIVITKSNTLERSGKAFERRVMPAFSVVNGTTTRGLSLLPNCMATPNDELEERI